MALHEGDQGACVLKFKLEFDVTRYITSLLKICSSRVSILPYVKSDVV